MMPSSTKHGSTKHYCVHCKKSPELWKDPAEATGLFKGTYLNESTQYFMPIKAYLCDYHADAMESGRFVEEDFNDA